MAAKTVTLITSGAGTATISATSLDAEQIAVITASPVPNYKFDHITTTNGIISQTDINTFRFTMSNPPRNTTITVYFKPVNKKSGVGRVIHAEWYNQ